MVKIEFQNTLRNVKTVKAKLTKPTIIDAFEILGREDIGSQSD